MAVAFIRQAVRFPGTHVYVFDHFGHGRLHSERALELCRAILLHAGLPGVFRTNEGRMSIQYEGSPIPNWWPSEECLEWFGHPEIGTEGQLHFPGHSRRALTPNSPERNFWEALDT